MITSKIPALPSSTKKILAIVLIAMILLIIGSALTARGEKGVLSAEVDNQASQTTQRKVRKTNNVLLGVDNDVEFAINPSKIKQDRSKIGHASNATVTGAGKKFVTVFVQVRNTGKKRVYLRADNQVLVTSEGKRIPASEDLQKLVTNGGWYKSVSPKGHASGTLVFEIDDVDNVDIIEFKSDRKSEGTKIKLN